MEQDLVVVGARVVHKEYGEGVIVEVDGGYPDLAPFIKAQSCLDNKMWWCYADNLKLVTPTQETVPKTESQQLVDILVQLGYVEHYPYNPVCSFNYAYGGKKLDIYWNEHKDIVCHDKHNGGCIYAINNNSLATNIAYFQKKLDKKLKKAAKQATEQQVDVATVDEQKVSAPTNVEQVTESKPAKLMKLPQINWTNRVANYDMVMEELRKNEFRQRKHTDLNSSTFYYWKYNPDLMVYVDIYFWNIMNDDNATVFSKLTEFGSVDKFRSELAKALKATPKRFKLKKDGK